MGSDFTPGLFSKEDSKVLFIFDLNSITSDKYVNGQPIPLDVFTELVDIFKDVEVDPSTFRYVSNENLIICDSETLTIEYMNSLKDKVKAEYAPLSVEESYNFAGFIRHIDIAITEMDFCNKYNVDSKLLCSTFVDYDTKTITIRSVSAKVQRSISLYASKLIKSCVYIINAPNKVTSLLTKYPYRDLIKNMYSTDFVTRSIPVTMPKEDDVKFNLEGKFVEYNIVNDTDSDAADSIKSVINNEFDKPEDSGYVEVIDTITNEQIREFFEDPNITLLGPKFGDNKVNYNQTEDVNKVVEDESNKSNESNAVSNMFNISDYSPPFTDNLYKGQNEEEEVQCLKKEVLEFITDRPLTVEEILDETKAYEDLGKINAAKAQAKAEGKAWYSRQDA